MKNQKKKKQNKTYLEIIALRQLHRLKTQNFRTRHVRVLGA
jgi:hypothetical protein